MKYSQNLEGQDYDELIVGFKGETFRDKGLWKKFDESLVIRQICQSIKVLCY